MRTLSYLILSLFIFSLASCSSDDDNNSQEVTILGKWDVTQMTMEGNFTEEGSAVSFSAVANSLPGNNMTFKADNTVSSNSAPFNIDFHYDIDGITYDMTQEVSSVLTTNGTWSRDGDLLHLQENGSSERQTYTVETLTGSTLKLSADQDNTDLGDDFPAGAQFRVTITMNR